MKGLWAGLAGASPEGVGGRESKDRGHGRRSTTARLDQRTRVHWPHPVSHCRADKGHPTVDCVLAFPPGHASRACPVFASPARRHLAPRRRAVVPLGLASCITRSPSEGRSNSREETRRRPFTASPRQPGSAQSRAAPTRRRPFRPLGPPQHGPHPAHRRSRCASQSPSSLHSDHT